MRLQPLLNKLSSVKCFGLLFVFFFFSLEFTSQGHRDVSHIHMYTLLFQSLSWCLKGNDTTYILHWNIKTVYAYKFLYPFTVKEHYSCILTRTGSGHRFRNTYPNAVFMWNFILAQARSWTIRKTSPSGTSSVPLSSLSLRSAQDKALFHSLHTLRDRKFFR